MTHNIDMKLMGARMSLIEQENLKSEELDDALVLLENTFFSLTALLDKPSASENLDKQKVTHFLLSKAMMSFWSTTKLVKYGCEPDGLSLIRTLLETVIALSTLIKDNSDDIFDRFVNFDIISKYKDIMKAKEYGLEHPDISQLSEITRKRTELLKRFGKSYKNKWSPYGGIEGNFKFLERESDYHRVYSLTSKFIHPSITMYHQFLLKEDSHATWAPIAKNGYRIANIAVQTIIWGVENYCKFHKVENFENPAKEIWYNLLSRQARYGNPIAIRYFRIFSASPVPMGKWGSFQSNT